MVAIRRRFTATTGRCYGTMTVSLAADATQAWDDLAQRLERFIATWEAGEEPTLVDYLPPEPPAHRRLVLIELIKFDLEQRTARSKPKLLEVYTAEFPELLENGEPPCDLIYEEYHVRRQAGHDITPRDYYQRFPRSAEALKRLMGTEDLSQSTQLFTAKRIEGFAAGQRVDDFELLVELGKGAFASVFLAKQVSMQRLVALKVSADKGTEPQTLASLDHPNIIRVYDQRTLPGLKIRVLYMQFAPGGTLADVVRYVRGTPAASRTGELLGQAVKDGLSKSSSFTFVSDESALKRRLANIGWPETVCRIGVQLAQALDHAHKQGTLHRDVKPANVLLAADGSPKLADFNISFSSQLDGATPAAYFGGSLAYMSPEQLEACNPTHERKPEELDGRSDLFALAVLLWELLHGERPFHDEEMTTSWTSMLNSMTERRKTEPPISPPATRDAVTQRLEKVLRKALAPDPANRHADGMAFARDLALCLNPHAWDLMHDLGSGWRSFAKRHPYLAMFPVNMPAFIVAGLFNAWYNYYYFVRDLDPEFEQAFKALIPYVNGVLYSAGIFLFQWSTIPVARALARIRRGETLEPDVLRKARRRAMTLGHYVAGIGLALWVVAGLWFPTGMWYDVGRIPKGGYNHFLLAMVACGIISACFPFLATTWLTVRVFFPALLANSAPEPQEQRQLLKLSKMAGGYLAISTVAPAIVAILLLMFSDDEGKETNSRLAIGILIATSILGFGLAYVIYQRIRGDLNALSIATRPIDMSGTTTDSVQSF